MRIGLTFDVKCVAGGECSLPVGDEEEEFDSPETIASLQTVLEGLGHDVLLLGDGEEMLRRLLDGPRPDLVLNIAEGRGASRSREARVPAVLEMLGIPHTGSDPLTLAVTLDKDCAKRLVRDAGVATPRWVLIEGDVDESAEDLIALPLPAIVKPAFEGSSKGVLSTSLVHGRNELFDAIARLRESYRQPLLVEEFIDGDELTVGLVGNTPTDVVGIMRVLPNDTTTPFVYSLEIKRDWQRQVRYECPARLSESDTEAVRCAALAAWKALGCRDVSRVDFRLRDGVPYFLEVNPLPGLSPTSGDLVLLAQAVGVEYPELIARIVQAAIERMGERCHA